MSKQLDMVEAEKHLCDVECALVYQVAHRTDIICGVADAYYLARAGKQRIEMDEPNATVCARHMRAYVGECPECTDG